MPKQVHLTYLTEARKQPYDPDVQDIEERARRRLRQTELHMLRRLQSIDAKMSTVSLMF